MGHISEVFSLVHSLVDAAGVYTHIYIYIIMLIVFVYEQGNIRGTSYSKKTTGRVISLGKG